MGRNKLDDKSQLLLENKTFLKREIETKSLKLLAEQLKCSRQTVKAYCEKHGIKTLAKGRPFKLTVFEKKEKQKYYTKLNNDRLKERGFVQIGIKLFENDNQILNEQKKIKDCGYYVIIENLLLNFKEMRKRGKTISMPLINTTQRKQKNFFVPKQTLIELKQISQSMSIDMGLLINVLLKNCLH